MLRKIMLSVEKIIVARALIAHEHNRTHAAEALGISRRTLLNKLKEWGMTKVRAVVAETAKQSIEDVANRT